MPVPQINSSSPPKIFVGTFSIPPSNFLISLHQDPKSARDWMSWSWSPPPLLAGRAILLWGGGCISILMLCFLCYLSGWSCALLTSCLFNHRNSFTSLQNLPVFSRLLIQVLPSPRQASRASSKSLLFCTYYLGYHDIPAISAQPCYLSPLSSFSLPITQAWP